jgi:hypothetical protein
MSRRLNCTDAGWIFCSDGSYYYQNFDGSKYYNSGDGYSQYTSPSGQSYSKKS